MNKNLQSVLDVIHGNSALNETDKKTIADFLKQAEKIIVLNEFKFHRVEKERNTLSILLEETIDELQKKSLVLEGANKTLRITLEDLKEAQQQLIMSEKMASLGQLTAGVAHEINNPINFVSANIKPLKEDLSEIIEGIHRYEDVIKKNKLEAFFEGVGQFNKDQDLAFTLQEVQELLKGIEEGAKRTSEIVKGLRNFSRLDQNVMKKADLNEGLDSTLAILHNVYKDDIEIVKEYGTIPEVECLPGEINQVLMNILSNAIQAITGAGKICIQTWEANNHVKIMIKDTGAGMDQAVQSKIFDPFFTTKEVGKGTGLGLSISYGIIKKHKGKIEVESVVGKGTEFIISLPVDQNENSGTKNTSQDGIKS
ncbi:ATP-binding protein [Pricia sp. S334]|uniref:histidine kinase n=1 Tax=Pricia mediterranea TaxID=3076079 RepID=A0ABU3L2C7_9FLAO|nr:ATP-binding protein [Pricia sp. S334]MDT7827334.1 ATP-binding protein [Pricia sp. S334]